MNSYHDYVIKDGNFIGKFDEMYRNCDDPWHQLSDGTIFSLGRTNVINIIKKMVCDTKTKSKVLEIGCGLGGFSYRLVNELGLPVTGLDISEAAIDRAKSSYKEEGLDFKVENIVNISRYKEYDIIVLSELLWYILDDLEQVLDCIKDAFSGSHLIILQSFYREGLQQYGKDFFTNIDELNAYIPFCCISKIVIDPIEGSSYETVSVYKI